ncbi:MAG TPA: YlcI/YnfO family protein [Pseudorhodoferax sp.]|jgi:hypothetical protein|nr:YlcI/YnfO family protein [Pseudorhodoferax sp.]
MKTATIPPVRIDPQLRDQIEQSLEEGETMTALVEKAVRHEVARRHDNAEFMRRGLAAIARTRDADDGIPAEQVIAKLESKLAAARKTRRA